MIYSVSKQKLSETLTGLATELDPLPQALSQATLIRIERTQPHRLHSYNPTLANSCRTSGQVMEVK